MDSVTITMLKTMSGSPDGIRQRLFVKDKTYGPKEGMTKTLAEVFVKGGYAEFEKKMIPAEYDNKMAIQGENKISIHKGRRRG